MRRAAINRGIRMLGTFIGVLHGIESKEWANFLMLARRAEVQKPRPALSFQNTEQGFIRTKIENYMGLAIAICMTTVLSEWRRSPASQQPGQRRRPSGSPGSR